MIDLNTIEGIGDLSAEQYRRLVNSLEQIEWDDEYGYRLSFDDFDFIYYKNEGEIIFL